MSYTSEKFNVAMKNAIKIAGQDLERMNNDWAKLREKSNKEIPKMLKDAAKEATASLKIDNEKLKEQNKELKEQLKKGGKAHLQDKKAYDTNLKIRESELDEKDQEIAKLNERCKFCNDFCPPLWCAKKLLEENEELKEENEKIGELVISQTDKLKEVSIKYNEGYKINQELKEEIAKKDADLEETVKEGMRYAIKRLIDAEEEEDDKCEKCGKGEKDFEDMFDGDALSTYAVNGKLWCPDCIHDDCNDESDEDEDEDED